ncbi:MAG: ornithine cyclodeaminase family protein [Candidatus Dormibacteraceae bacterium]
MALLIREDDVRRAIEMGAVIEAVEAATRELGLDRAQNQPRRRVRQASAVLSVMSASYPAAAVSGLKSYTVSEGRARFLVVLYGPGGAPTALIEADLMGAYRTGAATAVAARRLAPGSRRVAVFGTGHQARMQIRALARVLALEQLAVFSRDAGRRQAFAAEIGAELGVPTFAADSGREAAEGAELVVAITTSREPVLESSWIAPGALVVGAGSNLPAHAEIPPDLLGRCRLVAVDQVETARLESGDLIRAAERGTFRWQDAVELGALLAAPSDPQLSTPDPAGRDLVLFESHGLAIWDLAAGITVLARARELGLGEEVRLLD